MVKRGYPKDELQAHKLKAHPRITSRGSLLNASAVNIQYQLVKYEKEKEV